jgi:putative hydroxymethylpyrimidine transport system ATP-binding protein
VLENTVLGARLRGHEPDTKKAQDLLSRVGLLEHLHKKPNALSGGMRQRTALARTLMEDRPIALLDEPFSALDASTRADMQELAAEVLVDKTVLLVTHDPAEAIRLGHQIIVLTPDAAQSWPVPDLPPIRDQYAPATVACQAELLAYLREMR